MKVKGKLLGEEVTGLVRAVDKGLRRSSVYFAVNLLAL
jgi:hypothetical protein